MSNVIDIENVLSLMEIDLKGIGGLPLTVHVPAECIQTGVSGAVRDAEGGVRLSRMLLEASWERADRATASGEPKAIAEAANGAEEARIFWLETELAFAALLIKRSIPLAGRSMIALKK